MPGFPVVSSIRSVHPHPDPLPLMGEETIIVYLLSRFNIRDLRPQGRRKRGRDILFDRPFPLILARGWMVRQYVKCQAGLTVAVTGTA